MTVPITVVADDYGLSPGVSAGILALAAAGRLSGTGAMTLSPFWAEAGAGLAAAPAGFQVGLHFTLTGGLRPLGPMPLLAPDRRLPPLRHLLRLSLAGALTARHGEEIAAELERQLDRFGTVTGHPPAYLDGHQHVHVLPGIRRPVLDVLTSRYPAGSIWLRDCQATAPDLLARGVAMAKAGFIASLSMGMAAAAAARGIPTNRGFSGVYGFRGSFPDLMPRFLRRPRPGLLVMVHPALPDAALAGLDPVVAPRYAEMDYLSGPRWPADLAAAGVRLDIAAGTTS